MHRVLRVKTPWPSHDPSLLTVWFVCITNHVRIVVENTSELGFIRIHTIQNAYVLILTSSLHNDIISGEKKSKISDLGRCIMHISDLNRNFFIVGSHSIY
jgi:hypothetical protein